MYYVSQGSFKLFFKVYQYVITFPNWNKIYAPKACIPTPWQPRLMYPAFSCRKGHGQNAYIINQSFLPCLRHAYMHASAIYGKGFWARGYFRYPQSAFIQALMLGLQCLLD